MQNYEELNKNKILESKERAIICGSPTFLKIFFKKRIKWLYKNNSDHKHSGNAHYILETNTVYINSIICN